MPRRLLRRSAAQRENFAPAPGPCRAPVTPAPETIEPLFALSSLAFLQWSRLMDSAAHPTSTLLPQLRFPARGRAEFFELRFHGFIEAGGNDFLRQPDGVLDGARAGVAVADGADALHAQQRCASGLGVIHAARD